MPVVCWLELGCLRLGQRNRSECFQAPTLRGPQCHGFGDCNAVAAVHEFHKKDPGANGAGYANTNLRLQGVEGAAPQKFEARHRRP
jgi:hypothetical protein